MVRNFLKLNQTRYRVSHVYLERKTKRIFALACVGRKLAFQTEICLLLFQIINFKKGLFRRVKELSKLNQTGYGVYLGCLECKTKRIFAIACLRKMLVFRTLISD